MCKKSGEYIQMYLVCFQKSKWADSTEQVRNRDVTIVMFQNFPKCFDMMIYETKYSFVDFIPKKSMFLKLTQGIYIEYILYGRAIHISHTSQLY